MFKIVEFEKFKIEYVLRKNCAGIDWASDLHYGNLVFLKPIPEGYMVSQILYFRILGNVVVLQDKEFCNYYK